MLLPPTCVFADVADLRFIGADQKNPFVRLVFRNNSPGSNYYTSFTSPTHHVQMRRGAPASKHPGFNLKDVGVRFLLNNFHRNTVLVTIYVADVTPNVLIKSEDKK